LLAISDLAVSLPSKRGFFPMDKLSGARKLHEVMLYKISDVNKVITMKSFKLLTKLVGGLSVCALLGVSSFTLAQLGVSNTGISGTLQTTGVDPQTQKVAYGGCMARLTSNQPFPTAAFNAAGCSPGGDTYVSFDCEGYFGSKSASQANFSAAQLAFVTGKAVYIGLGGNKISGFCVVDTIQVLSYPTPP